MCRNRNVSSGTMDDGSGRISSRRTRLRRRVGPAPAPRAATAPRRPRARTRVPPPRRAPPPVARPRAARRGAPQGARRWWAGIDRRQVAGRTPAVACTDEVAVLDQHRDELLHEQRIALGDLLDAAEQIELRGRPEERPDQRRGCRRSPRPSSRTVWASSLPPPHVGRLSSRSGRASATTRIGAPRLPSTRCSTRSRKVDSAH